MMTRYYTVDEKGNWMEADEGLVYDAAEHLESLIQRINNWDHEDVREIRDIIDQMKEVVKDLDYPLSIEEVIDFSILPSEPIPNDVPYEHMIWSMDKAGRVLHGYTADKIDWIEDLLYYD